MECPPPSHPHKPQTRHQLKKYVCAPEYQLLSVVPIPRNIQNLFLQDDDVDVKKQKTENGTHEENGEEEEDAEEEEDIGEEEEDLDGEGEDELDEEDGGEGKH